jgi:glycosyltransferase involved in cell wall biosynthesis
MWWTEPGTMQDTRELIANRPRSREAAPLEVVAAPVDDAPLPAPCVDVVIPVFNEARVLEGSVARLHDYLGAHFPFTWRITIVDNASDDGTWFRAARLARDSEHVRAVHLDVKGRGLALRTAWCSSDAAVVAYMDVDLSTDLDALLPLVAPLVSGHSDVSIGSRLSAGASVARRPKRELISRSYNAILHSVFATEVSDAQCGFKALRADVARCLLPAVKDDGWFFDTELLLLAEHNGLRIHEVPVDWVDDPDSRVHVARTAIDDLAGALRMARSFARGGGRIDLGDAVRKRVDDDFGRRIVTIGLISAASLCLAIVLFLVLSGTVGRRPASAIALGMSVAVAARRLGVVRAAARPGVLR